MRTKMAGKTRHTVRTGTHSTRRRPRVNAGLLMEYSPQLFCIVLLYLQPFLHKLCIALQEVDAPLRVLVKVLELVLWEEEREHRQALSGEHEVKELGTVVRRDEHNDGCVGRVRVIVFGFEDY